MSFLSVLLGAIKPADKYSREKAIALSDNKRARMKLAKSGDTHKEILYYLAQNDVDAQVRRAVAANNATPYQVNPVIVADPDVDVRLALAERLVRLLPGLSNDKHSQVYAYTIQALGQLAHDEVVKVRTALSLTLRDELHAPPEVVGVLARDIERQVAEPILRYCVAVPDSDLLEILKNYPPNWTIEAIAGRKQVSGRVSDSIIDAYNEAAGVVLISNQGAYITPDTLERIVEKARSFLTWQKPLAVRKFLPPSIAKTLSEFVDDSVRGLLMERTDLDKDMLDDMGESFRQRVAMIEEGQKAEMTAEDRVKLLIAEKRLNEDAVVEAMNVRDRDFVIVALAALCRTSRSNMESIIGIGKAKPVIAVCWRAGLSMRLCLRVQQQLAQVPSRELVYPRGGTDYPLEEAELQWQLEFLGLA